MPTQVPTWISGRPNSIQQELEKAYAPQYPTLKKWWDKDYHEIDKRPPLRATFDEFWEGSKREQRTAPSFPMPESVAKFDPKIAEMIGTGIAMPEKVAPFGHYNLGGMTRANFVPWFNQINVRRDVLHGASADFPKPYDVGTLAHELAHYFRLNKAGVAGLPANFETAIDRQYAIKDDPTFQENARMGKQYNRDFPGWAGAAGRNDMHPQRSLHQNMEYEADRAGVTARFEQTLLNHLASLGMIPAGGRELAFAQTMKEGFNLK